MSDAIDRRRVLGAAGTLIAAELLASACSNGGGSIKPGQVAVASSDLAGGRRVTVTVGENPVEVFRGESGAVTARLLRCTHTGCVVKWDAPSRRYLCLCHDGRFDENGNPISGPAPAPLHLVPVVVEGSRVIVG